MDLSSARAPVWLASTTHACCAVKKASRSALVRSFSDLVYQSDRLYDILEQCLVGLLDPLMAYPKQFEETPANIFQEPVRMLAAHSKEQASAYHPRWSVRVSKR
jgi:hypothetical protein